MERLKPWLPTIALTVLGLMSLWVSSSALAMLHAFTGQDVFGFDRVTMAAVRVVTPASLEPFLWLATGFLNVEAWPIWILLYLVGAAVLARAGRRWEAVGVGVGLAITFAGISLAKVFFHRIRPDVPWALASETSFSFPSGHAATAITFYGLAAYLAARVSRRWSVALVAGAAAAGLALFTGWSRVYLAVHYPTDVIAGFAAGAIWLATGIAFTETLYMIHQPHPLLVEHSRRVLAFARHHGPLLIKRWHSFRRRVLVSRHRRRV